MAVQAYTQKISAAHESLYAMQRKLQPKLLFLSFIMLFCPVIELKKNIIIAHLHTNVFDNTFLYNLKILQELRVIIACDISFLIKSTVLFGEYRIYACGWFTVYMCTFLCVTESLSQYDS